MGLPLVNWSVRTLALQLVEDGSVTQIHYSSVCLILQDAECQPHRTLYWKRGHDPEFESKALHVLWYYENIARLAEKGEQFFCIDEKPGIQRLGAFIRTNRLAQAVPCGVSSNMSATAPDCC
jgi:hypothetical protein